MRYGLGMKYMNTSEPVPSPFEWEPFLDPSLPNVSFLPHFINSSLNFNNNINNQSGNASKSNNNNNTASSYTPYSSSSPSSSFRSGILLSWEDVIASHYWRAYEAKANIIIIIIAKIEIFDRV